MSYKTGRPTKYSEEIVAKLEAILKVGGTIEEAASYAGIDPTTFRRWVEKYPDFASRMAAAQYFADVVAKNVVVDSIVKDKNLESAKWWLDRRVFRQSQNTTNIQINFEILDEKGNPLEVR